jgi:tight adherence protein C
MMITFFYTVLGIACFLACIGVILFFLSLHEKSDMEKRSAVILNPHLRALDVRKHTTRVVDKFSTVIHTMRGRMGAKTGESKLKRRLYAAGLYDPKSEDAYIGIRILLPLVLVGSGAFFTRNLVPLVVLALAGFMLPDFLLERRGKKRLSLIRLALPDTVDLLVICMDAGLGIDQAVQRTADVLYIAYPDLCGELVHLGRLQSLGMETSKAWAQMVKRTKSPDIEQIASLLHQTETFGTPISDAMRILADSLRIKRKQRAEERAARSGVILLMPLVVFIFPVIFIVLLGPAALNIMHGFHSTFHH